MRINPKQVLNLPGKLTISRTQGGRSPQTIRIEIEDGISHTLVLRLETTPHSFGECVTGLGYVDCTLEVYQGAPWGKKHENKTEVVAVVEKGYKISESAMDEALKLLEVDGWKADRSCFGNYHNWVGQREGDVQSYRVVFHRYVEETDATQ